MNRPFALALLALGIVHALVGSGAVVLQPAMSFALANFVGPYAWSLAGFALLAGALFVRPRICNELVLRVGSLLLGAVSAFMLLDNLAPSTSTDAQTGMLGAFAAMAIPFYAVAVLVAAALVSLQPAPRPLRNDTQPCARSDALRAPHTSTLGVMNRPFALALLALGIVHALVGSGAVVLQPAMSFALANFVGPYAWSLAGFALLAGALFVRPRICNELVLRVGSLLLGAVSAFMLLDNLAPSTSTDAQTGMLGAFAAMAIPFYAVAVLVAAALVAATRAASTTQ